VSEWKWEVIGVSNVIRLSSSFAPRRASYDENVFAVQPAVTRLHEEDEMLEELDRRERLRLVQFVCSFAWADFEIQPEERVFISRLIRRLDLDDEEDLQVQQWLDRPPALDDLDPTSIPTAHRRFFVEAIEGLISADGEIAEEERESFEIFKQLLTH
jgi:uncharacterized tellurite resistance protein B-like protein